VNARHSRPSASHDLFAEEEERKLGVIVEAAERIWG